MGLDVRDVREYVVRPALQAIGLWSAEAEELVLATGAHESAGFRYLDQVDRSLRKPGPAFGLFQMERATHDDHWDWLGREKNEDLAARVAALAVDGLAWERRDEPPDAAEMQWNLRYAAAMCRVHYRRKPGALPLTIEGMAAYWKKWYNTELGDGTEAEFLRDYRVHVRGIR